MLSIEHSNNVDAAVRYFRENLAQADYYCETTSIIGKWHGKLADKLELKDEVRAEDFEKLLYNTHPQTGERLTARNSANRRPLYDCTFSSSKSASIMLAITKDKEILGAHQKAVKDAMLAMQADLQTQMGTGQGKHYQTTGNGIWAEFVHEFSRPLKKQIDGKTAYIPDPQLHSHCTLINATFHKGQNRYRALEMSNLKRSAPYYEAIYHSAYAQYLKKAGYEVEKRGKRWELKAISRETIEKFSGRTLEIEALAKERGIKNAKAKAALGRLTRNDKHQSISDEKLPSHWKDRLSLSEYQAIMTAKGKEKDGGDEDSGATQITAERAVNLSLSHHLQRNSSVQEKRALAYAIDLTSGIVSPDKIIEELQSRDNLIRGEYRTLPYITTKEMLRSEEALIEKATASKNTKAPLNPEYEIQNPIFNEGQRAAIDHVLQSEDQIIMVAGDAGVGKTTLFQTVKDGIEQTGKKMFAFAPSSDASRKVLREKGFKDADTIKKLLQDKELQNKLKNNAILIDEAGLVPVDTMNKLFDISKAQNSRLILSGDYKQHSAVEAGDALKLLETHSKLPVARVNEIVRQQKAARHKEVIEKLANGIGLKGNSEKRKDEVVKAFDKLDTNGNVIEINDRQERQKQLAQDYLKETTAKNADVMVVAPTHREKDAITNSIRETLTQNKRLGEQKQFSKLQDKQLSNAEKELTQSYLKDDIVQFHKNITPFKAGEKYKVSEITDKGQVLVTSSDYQTSPLPQDNRDRYSVYKKQSIQIAENDKIRITKNMKALSGKELNNGQVFDVKGFDKTGNIKLSNNQTIAKNAEHIDYGYVSTSFKSQGRDAKTALIAQSSDSLGASNDRQFYVSVSRASENCRVYTDDKKALRHAVSRSGDTMSAHQVNQLNHSSQVTREEKERMNYKAHVKTFYQEKVKPNLEKLKTYYEQRGLEKKMDRSDIGLER